LNEGFAVKKSVAVLFFCLFAFLQVAQAKDWPNKPIKLIVPFPAAGGTDAVARALANKLSQQLNQPVIVENKAGANGVIGAEAVAHAPPDGYTIMITIASHAIAPAVSKKLPYDTEKDFVGVSLIAKYPYLFTVPANSPANTFKEFIDLAKKNPGKLTYASSGTGSAPHLGMELLLDIANIDLIHVPYKGAAPANNDLIGGQVQSMLNNLLAGAGLIRAKKLKVLAVTSSARSPALPDIPTIKESGYPKYEVDGWYGVFVPAKTPPEIVKQLSVEIAKALKDPELLSRLSNDGAIPIGSTPKEFQDFFMQEKNQWANLAKKIKLEVD
jgi:tripartite-type tricarboxylate transporter receptor subunit TctC